MGYSLIPKWLFWVVIVLILFSYESQSCIDREKFALLQIKKHLSSFPSFPSSPKDRNPFLPSWVGDTTGNCCSWERVRCDPFSGRVIELSLGSLLDSTYEFEGAYVTVEDRSLNMTIFQDFEKLQSLDLSLNCIKRLVEEEAMCKTRNLQLLNLANNEMDGRIPDCISNLSFLTTLGLSGNQFTGNPPDVSELKKLENLDLSYNQFGGSILSTLSNLKSLKTLDISNNHFQDKFSLSLFSDHSNLSFLALSNNMFEIETEDSDWIPSFQLQTLQLSNCSVNKETKTLPTFLTHQYLLEILDLSYNGLVGSFPTSLFQSNSHLEDPFFRNSSRIKRVHLSEHHNISSMSLQYLDLSHNSFSGKLPENIGWVLSGLKWLILSGNYFEGPIPRSLCEIKGLKFLILSSNKFSGKLPENIGLALSSLTCLSLDGNYFEGQIPSSICELKRLEVLDLSNNNFSGEVPKQLFNNSNNLVVLSLSNNNLHGEIDSLLRAPNLVVLDISNNKISGEIPSWIGTFEQLYFLSVGGNRLQGRIPSAICNLSLLLYLDLSKNGFTGQLPPCIGTKLTLSHLYLHNINLTGHIPHQLSAMSTLVVLDLRDNQLIGGIPLWIDLLSKLHVLQLGNNMLEGQLPAQLCSLQRLNILDVSSNEISGIIPSCLKNLSFGKKSPDWDGYTGRGYFEFITKGVLENYVGGTKNLMSGLDMSCNQLTGHIPSELGDLMELLSLNLSHNKLTGFIPETFSNLKEIESLDLSYNSLSGAIPSEFENLHFLEDFNVSYNNLSGRVPQTGQFATFDGNSYKGNPFLWGYVQDRSWIARDALIPTSGEDTREDDEENNFDWRLFFWSFGVSFVVFFFTFYCGALYQSSFV